MSVPRDLSLEEALARGLKSNLGALLAAGRVETAEGARRQALARLLPELSAEVSDSRQKIDLEAYGFPPPPGESPLVGPFNVFDARLKVSGTLFDAAAAARAHAAARALTSERLTYQEARDRVSAAVADLYLRALSASARVEAAAAEVETGRATAEEAEDRQKAGSAAGIEVLRAKVTFAAARQRWIEARGEQQKTDLALARAVGLPLDRPLHLTDTVPFALLPLGDVKAAVARALEQRPDLASASAQVEAAEASVAAARRQRLPSLGVRADWGSIGSTASDTEHTYSVAAGLRIPLFEGGRIAGDVREAQGRLDQARATLDDLRSRVELDVRSAYLDQESAAERVEVASEARELAASQLEQAQDRFTAGVADGLEVVQAQEAVAAAAERYVSALYDFNRAKVNLALALGVAENATASFLRGEPR
ncbi:MAG: TolC family protein [Acidobacteria bacterium]|nr:TolC family protein [Acidobacteriota bacterium]